MVAFARHTKERPASDEELVGPDAEMLANMALRDIEKIVGIDAAWCAPALFADAVILLGGRPGGRVLSALVCAAGRHFCTKAARSSCWRSTRKRCGLWKRDSTLLCRTRS